MPKALELKDQKFNRLTVLEKISKRTNAGKIRWLCKCDCGNIVKTRGSHLKSGNTKSCGCLNKDLARLKVFKHGHAAIGKKTKTYIAWKNMRIRCNNPKDKAYKWYGARDITVCKGWNDFRNFLEDMGEAPKGLTIERTDNDGNYEPNNCKWDTYTQQARNRRNNKLNPLKVQVIKKLLKESNLTQKDIAEIFHVANKTINKINNNKQWKDAGGG